MSQQPEASAAHPPPLAGPGGEALAVFDLDGTLIRGDSSSPS